MSSHLENFANKCTVPQLAQCFVELKELVLALLMKDLTPILDNPIQIQVLFPTLNPLKFACVLEKVNVHTIFVMLIMFIIFSFNVNSY